VKLFAKGLDSELRDGRVRVTAVFPGAMETNIAANSGLGDLSWLAGGGKTPPMWSPRKAARLVLDGMEKDRYRVLVGPDARLMDVLYRLSPRRAAAFIYRQMCSIVPG
jgi:short-subunit dehydrogenase